VDPGTRRVRVEAEIENGTGNVRAGSFVRARVTGKDGIQVLKLPHDTLRPGSQDELFVVKGGALVSRRVVYAISRDGELLVRGGLEPSEHVVRGPKADATAGNRVLEQAAAPGAAAPAAPAGSGG
jgi:multidrug efflux pump subunit AcrA (membrane-fusion protein)